MTLLVLTLAGCSLLLVMLAIPMMWRRVGPNGLYGLRTPATFADEWVWYEANARSGLDLLVLGSLLLILALVLPAFGLSPGSFGLIWSAVAVVGVLLMATIGWRRANRLLRERRKDSGSAA